MKSPGNVLPFKSSGFSEEEREKRRRELSARRRVDNEKADQALKTLRESGKTRILREDANQLARNLRDILNRAGKDNWAEICRAAGVSDRSTKNLGRYTAEKGKCSTAWAKYHSLAKQAALHYPPADGDEQFFLADLIRGTSFEPTDSSISFIPDSDGWAKEVCRVLSKLEGVLPSNIQGLLEKCHAAKLVADKPLAEKPDFFSSEDWFCWHSMYFLDNEWVHDFNLPDSVNTIPVCLLGKTADCEAQCQISFYRNVLGQEQTPPAATAAISMALEFHYAYPADCDPFIAIKPLGEIRVGDSTRSIKSIFRINPIDDNIYKTPLCIVTDTGTDKNPVCPEVFHCAIDLSNGFVPLHGLLEAAPFIYRSYEGVIGTEESFRTKHADLISGNELLYYLGNSYYCELLNAENCLKYFRVSSAGEYPDFSVSVFPDGLAPELLPPAGSVAAHIINNLRQPENPNRFDQQLIVQCQHIESELKRLSQNLCDNYEKDMRWLLDK